MHIILCADDTTILIKSDHASIENCEEENWRSSILTANKLKFECF